MNHKFLTIVDNIVRTINHKQNLNYGESRSITIYSNLEEVYKPLQVNKKKQQSICLYSNHGIQHIY